MHHILYCTWWMGGSGVDKMISSSGARFKNENSSYPNYPNYINDFLNFPCHFLGPVIPAPGLYPCLPELNFVPKMITAIFDNKRKSKLLWQSSNICDIRNFVCKIVFVTHFLWSVFLFVFYMGYVCRGVWRGVSV